MSMKSSGDNGPTDLGVQMVPDVQTIYESDGFQSLSINERSNRSNRFTAVFVFRNRVLIINQFGDGPRLCTKRIAMRFHNSLPTPRARTPDSQFYERV